ncbi:MAG: RHS repeat-associated core domain-containing protein [Candidatus Saccharibacteria bacterium]|nr:RHS repeat-associated core domain-containing protein [Candidatus Saccharibacteria bacterium]
MTDLESSAIMGGITQMGARVYLPILGRFLQVDPVEGGTDNNYAYANDPVNEFDLDGQAIPILFLLSNVARMAAPHIARAAVKYIAKPAVRVAARRVVPLFKKGAGHVARWGVNSFKKFTGSRLPKFVTRGPGAAQNLRESLVMREAIGRGG